MANNKHLLLSERIRIGKCLNDLDSFKAIGRELKRDCSTISKEVRNHILYKQVGCLGNAFNNCKFRFDCSIKSLCASASCGNKFCRFCSKCHLHCDDYELEGCPLLFKPPYVSAMDVKSVTDVLWKNGFTLLDLLRRNTRKFFLNHALAFPSPKKRPQHLMLSFPLLL